MWPVDAESLIDAQRKLARADPEPWRPAGGELRIGGCWVCFPRGLTGPGDAGDVAWAAAVVMQGASCSTGRYVAASRARRTVPGCWP